MLSERERERGRRPRSGNRKGGEGKREGDVRREEGGEENCIHVCDSIEEHEGCGVASRHTSPTR
eukprot:1328072-Amorphochlora_amoeboformis.AAC.1